MAIEFPPRPLLVYDGDCEFCNYCVDYARSATGPAVEYQPFQSVGSHYPHISEEQYRASIWLIKPDGSQCSGAAAAFEALAVGGHTRWWHMCYTLLPLFAVISEYCYRFVSRHRSSCLRLAHLLFGRALQPAAVTVTAWLFLRLLALIYLAAFISFTLQAPGLIGSEGILPAERYFSAVDVAYGADKYWLLPSLLWVDSSTLAIQFLGWAGAGIAALLLFNILPGLCLPALYLLYLSLYHGGQVFMSFQWDILLLECGFLAIFLRWNPRLFSWLYRLLLFRFMLQSGLVKLMSGDTTWHDLSALNYHFETQPLPTILAWYADKLPQLLLQGGVAFTLLVELVVPFLILMPRRPRLVAGVTIGMFQLLIIATGSYNYFNFLTLCLCLLLLDDQFLLKVWPSLSRYPGSSTTPGSPAKVRSAVAAAIAFVYVLQSGILLDATGSRSPLSATAHNLLKWNAPFHMANGYGLFAVMTTQRREVIIEGSQDGREWQAYQLPYNPGVLDRPPVWATPHQPRLDWQLWFAALGPREQNPWLGGLISGLFRGSKPVLDLFEYNPFPDSPPQYIRASLYLYEFSDRETYRRSGQWWLREYDKPFWPVTAWRVAGERY